MNKVTSTLPTALKMMMTTQEIMVRVTNEIHISIYINASMYMHIYFRPIFSMEDDSVGVNFASKRQALKTEGDAVVSMDVEGECISLKEIKDHFAATAPSQSSDDTSKCMSLNKEGDTKYQE